MSENQNYNEKSIDNLEYRRVLIVDDSEGIHQDFNKILLNSKSESESFSDAKSAFFGCDEEISKSDNEYSYKIDSAMQGEQALDMVIQSVKTNHPYEIAFVDMRMPPGWDGIETVKRIWQVDSNIQIVICTAYSDYSWEEMEEELGQSDNLLLLKKPFDHLEVKQFASSLTTKWKMSRLAAGKVEELEKLVYQRTCELENKNNKLETTIQELKNSKEELCASEKMASVGVMATELTQQINSPIQYVSENLTSSMDLIQSVEQMLEICTELVEDAESLDVTSKKMIQFRELERVIDFESIQSELTLLTQGSMYGLNKISGLIQGINNLVLSENINSSQSDHPKTELV